MGHSREDGNPEIQMCQYYKNSTVIVIPDPVSGAGQARSGIQA